MSIRMPLRRLWRRSYRLAWTYDGWRYNRPSRHPGPPLVVYQMGKVGSTSVYRTLKDAVPDRRVYHVHTLVPSEIAAAERAYARTYAARRVIPHHLLASRHLLEELRRGQPRGRWTVVTIVREPIARNVSSFFQTLQLRHPDFPYTRKLASGTTQQLAADLVELFLQRHDHEEPLRWCDRELGGVLGVDVYAAPFPHDRRYQSYAAPWGDLLLLRMENLNETLQPAVTDLLGGSAATPAPPAANTAAGKPYGPLYEAFRETLTLPDTYVEQMYESRYARHFYTAAELETFRRQWLRAPQH